MSKIRDFISLIIQAAREASLKISVDPYRDGSGAMIRSLEVNNADVDRFLIEITSIADQDHMTIGLALPYSNVQIKNEFQRHHFFVQNDHQGLQMERNPQGISFTELEFMESAPPGKKAERFIRHQKKDFKKRYGKRWKEVLYATAWKQFGEGFTFKDSLMLIEAMNVLCEMELPDSIFEQATYRMIENIDWYGGGGETVIYELGYDPNGKDEEEFDPKSPEVQDKLHRWAEQRVHDAYHNISDHFEGDVIHVYRMITARPNWKPDPNRHPGDYWSWDEGCADAHWGSFRNGNIKWMLEAKVKSSQIDWIQTLAVNAGTDSEDECEINTIADTPIQLLSYRRVR